MAFMSFWKYWLWGWARRWGQLARGFPAPKEKEVDRASCHAVLLTGFSSAGFSGVRELETSVYLFHKLALSIDRVPGTLWGLGIQRWAGCSGLCLCLGVLSHC